MAPGPGIVVLGDFDSTAIGGTPGGRQMRKLTSRGIALAAASALAVTALASCSSDDPEASPTESTSEIVIDDTLPADTMTEEPIATGAVAAACDAYFQIDLLNSAYAGGAVADGDMTEAQVKDEMNALIKELNAQATLAVDDGSADAKMLANAKRMKKIVNGLKKKQALKDLSKAKQKNFATASLRIQRSCDRAGVPLPADNVTARTAAGL